MDKKKVIGFDPEALDYLLRWVARQAVAGALRGDRRAVGIQERTTFLVDVMVNQMERAAAVDAVEISTTFNRETISRWLNGFDQKPDDLGAFREFIDGLDM
jgi:hypothetical protein